MLIAILAMLVGVFLSYMFRARKRIVSHGVFSPIVYAVFLFCSP